MINAPLASLMALMWNRETFKFNLKRRSYYIMLFNWEGNRRFTTPETDLMIWYFTIRPAEPRLLGGWSSCDQPPSTTSRSTSTTSAWGLDPRAIEPPGTRTCTTTGSTARPLGLLAIAIGSDGGVSVADDNLTRCIYISIMHETYQTKVEASLYNFIESRCQTIVK